MLKCTIVYITMYVLSTAVYCLRNLQFISQFLNLSIYIVSLISSYIIYLSPELKISPTSCLPRIEIVLRQPFLFTFFSTFEVVQIWKFPPKFQKFPPILKFPPIICSRACTFLAMGWFIFISYIYMNLGQMQSLWRVLRAMYFFYSPTAFYLPNFKTIWSTQAKI